MNVCVSVRMWMFVTQYVGVFGCVCAVSLSVGVFVGLCLSVFACLCY